MTKEEVEKLWMDNPESMQFLKNATKFYNLMMMYRCAIREIQTKLEVLDDEFSVENNRNPISFIKTRIKKPNSIYNKLQKMGHDFTTENIQTYLNDVAGVRIVCAFIDDIYMISDLITQPSYGKYEDYNASEKENTISDLQLVSWILGNCATLDEVKEAVKSVHVVNIDPRSSTVHWRFTDAEGKQLVLEITEQTPHFFENTLGVLTNSPGFEWQLTNLNNYVNLFPGTAPAQDLGTTPLKSFGAGSGFLGIPGDVTPPSRFVRAAFYQSTAPLQDSAEKT